MNKNAIQKFAIWARNELIAQVSQRAYNMELTSPASVTLLRTPSTGGC